MLLRKHILHVSLLASAMALTACGSSSSGSDSGPGAGRDGDSFNSLSISAKGGSSTLGSGGNGGEVDILKLNSENNLNLVKQGKIDTSYTLPEQTPEFGSNPVTIETTQTVNLVEDGILPAAGVLYMLPGQFRLFKSSGDKTLGHETHEVTGLTVNSSATLYLPANSTSYATLYFNNDVQNNGVISTVNENTNARDGLELTTAAYYGTGNIDLKGDTANLYRQSGGNFSLTAHTIINSGLINTSGANKSSENTSGNGGGNAGSITLNANVFIENTGELRANGGHSDADAGTNGGNISLSAASIVNTGEINSNSGSGNNQNYNSNSSNISFYADKSILNTGTISSKGADASDTGDASKGGYIRFNLEENSGLAFNQSLINTGDLIVDGGSIVGTSTGHAGNGGTINIYTDTPNEEANGPVVFEISGNLSANGGSSIEDGSSAGNAGNIYIKHYDNPSSTSETFLIGYSEINTSGGNGVYSGYAGEINIDFDDFRNYTSYLARYVPTLTGSIYNDVDLIANGGSTTAETQDAGVTPIYGNGSDGGYVSLNAFNKSAYLQPGAINITNEGSISVNGGDSFNNSSRGSATGGDVDISASHEVKVTQPITLDGGSDVHVATSGESNNHAGSNAGDLNVSSQYEKAIIDTDISANGGNGDLLGGHGGLVYITSKNAISLKGSISLNGANTSASEVDGLETEGGDAGTVYAISESMDSNVDASITANAGSGDQVGEEKIIYVDADCLSNNCDLP